MANNEGNFVYEEYEPTEEEAKPVKPSDERAEDSPSTPIDPKKELGHDYKSRKYKGVN